MADYTTTTTIRVMVLAHHIILTGYGHWLPNDPRGSLSKEVRAGKLFPLGSIHYGRKEVQPAREELRAFRQDARPRLEYELLWFDSAKRQAIAEAFARVVAERVYTCFACAIMSNHAHLVIRRHRDKAETMIVELLKASATRLRCFADVPTAHPIWSSNRFKKFLSSADEIERTICYVEENPVKEGEAAQSYDFVTPYRGEWSNRRR